MKFLIYVTLLISCVSSLDASTFGDYLRDKKALKKFDEGNIEKAAEIYFDAIKKNVKSPELNHNLGNLLYEAKDYDTSIKFFKRATTFLPENKQSISLYHLGNAYYQKEEYKKAYETYKQALKLKPQDTQIKHNLELSLIKLENEKNSTSNEQQENNQQNQQNQQNQKDQNKNQEQNQDNQNEDQKNDEDQDPEDQQNQDDSKKDQSENQKEGSNEDQKEQPQSKEEKETAEQQNQAKQILNALEENEKETRMRYLQKALPQKTWGVDKDW